jgi:hypothetical protein
LRLPIHDETEVVAVVAVVAAAVQLAREFLQMVHVDPMVVILAQDLDMATVVLNGGRVSVWTFAMLIY